MLFGLLFSSYIYILAYCVFWVVWTIQTQFCPDPLWAICFCEALSKCSHALLLSSTLSFSWDGFLWQAKLFDVLTCLKHVEKQPFAVLISLLRLFKMNPFLLCDQNCKLVMLMGGCTDKTDLRQGAYLETILIGFGIHNVCSSLAPLCHSFGLRAQIYHNNRQM